jgi:hypothetical protein
MLQTIVGQSDMLLQIPLNAADLTERYNMMVNMMIEDLEKLLEESKKVC